MGSGVYTNVADEGHLIKNSNVSFSSVEMNTLQLRLMPAPHHSLSTNSIFRRALSMVECKLNRKNAETNTKHHQDHVVVRSKLNLGVIFTALSGIAITHDDYVYSIPMKIDEHKNRIRIFRCYCDCAVKGTPMLSQNYIN